MSKNNKIIFFIITLFIILALSVSYLFFLLQNSANTQKSFQKKFVIHETFYLSDHNNNKISEKSLLGHPSIIFFGFTHCPEICPTTLYDISRWKSIIGKSADIIKTYFITLDPRRDTQLVLKNYLSNFDNVLGITGEEIQIINFAKSWGIYRKVVPVDNTEYSLDHTATIFLINENSTLNGTIAFGENEEVAVQKIKNLIQTK